MNVEYCIGVADDMEEFREGMVDLIKGKLGIPAFPYDSGEAVLEALEKEGRFRHSVLILDQIMPKAKGIDTFRTIATDKRYREHLDKRRILVSGLVIRSGQGREILDRALDEGIIHEFYTKDRPDIDQLLCITELHHRTRINLDITRDKCHIIKHHKIHANSIRMRVDIYLPVDLNKAKGIILFTHGLGYLPRAYRFDGPEAAAYDYLVVVPTMRGHGLQRDVFTVEDAVNDINELIRKIQEEHSFPNADCVYTIGHSVGGLINQLASIQNSDIRATVWVSPLTSLETSYRHMFESGHMQNDLRPLLQENGVFTQGLDRVTSNPEGIKLLREGVIDVKQMAQPNIYGMMRVADMGQFVLNVIGWPHSIHEFETKKPVFLVSATRDEKIPVNEAIRFYESVRVPPGANQDRFKALYKTAATNHFQNNQWQGIIRRSIDFINRL